MVIGVCEYEALNSLHELRIVILEEPSYAPATSRVGHNGERSGPALTLSHEVFPDVLAVLKVIPTVRNCLF